MSVYTTWKKGKGLTNREVAKLSGISRHTIDKISRTKDVDFDRMQIATVHKLIKAFPDYPVKTGFPLLYDLIKMGIRKIKNEKVDK